MTAKHCRSEDCLPLRTRMGQIPSGGETTNVFSYVVIGVSESVSTQEGRNTKKKVTLSRDLNSYVRRSAQDFRLNVKFSRFQMEIPGSKQELKALLNPHKSPSSDIIGENEQ